MEHRIVLLAAVMCTACSADPVTTPKDVSPLLTTGTAPRGFGFYSQPGGTSASAITDGGALRCQESGAGAGLWILPITPGIAAKVQAFLAGGGTAWVEVQTKFRYAGIGDMRATENIELLGSGGSMGSASASGSASSPGFANGGLIEPRTTWFPVSAASLVAGAQLEVSLTGKVSASLPVCSKPLGGQVRWTYSMPILWLWP